jgi:hypothetical protein
MTSVIDGKQPAAGAREKVLVRTRASLPVVPLARPEIPNKDRGRLDAIAARLLREEPALGDSTAFGERVRAGLAEDGRALAFEDHSGLALFARRGVVLTEYRPLLLAGDGDFVAIGERPDPEFETYCREILRLGQVERLFPAPETGMAMRLPRRLLHDADAMNRLVEAARRDGVVSLIPYYSNGGCWVLGREIAARSGAQVRIAAAPPRLTRRVNDKLWFADRVAEVLGRRARPMTLYAYGPAAMAAELRTLARHHERVIVKVPDSAGSLGNLAVSAEDILSRPFVELRSWLIETLTGLHWDGGWPLLVGVWDSPAIGSPSVQTWIPETRDGLPVIEGIFEQVVEGPRGAFVGAVPADLPDSWIMRLAHEAVLLAGLLQRLGYYGRCSFDAVLAGRSLQEAELHWIECNGRWGGVSIPMTLANRLTGNWRRRPFVVVQREALPLRPLTVDQAVDRLGDRLFRPGTGDEGIVILTPRLMAEGRGLHFMALARTGEAARAMARDCIANLSGQAQ